jgi:hypothetical protein
MFFTLDQIENGFFEAIRLSLIQGGYLPDITVYPTQSQFKAQIEAIIADNKPVIRLYGVGNYKARAETSNAKIVIDRLTTSRGSIATPNRITYQQQPNLKYSALKSPQAPQNVLFQISWVSEDQSVNNLIEGLMLECLDTKGYLIGYNGNATPTTDKFYYVKQDEGQNNEDKFIERYVRYVVPNVYITQPKVVQTDIPLATEIYTDVISLKYGDSL